MIKNENPLCVCVKLVYLLSLHSSISLPTHMCVFTYIFVVLCCEAAPLNNRYIITQEEEEEERERLQKNKNNNNQDKSSFFFCTFVWRAFCSIVFVVCLFVCLKSRECTQKVLFPYILLFVCLFSLSVCLSVCQLSLH